MRIANEVAGILDTAYCAVGLGARGLACNDCLEKESLLAPRPLVMGAPLDGTDVLEAIVDMVVGPEGSADGLKPDDVMGGLALAETPPCFSLSYLLRYVIKFSFDFKLSWASSSFCFKVWLSVLIS